MFRTLFTNSFRHLKGGQVTRTFVGCTIKKLFQTLTVSQCSERLLKARSGGCLAGFPPLFPTKRVCLSERYFSTVQEEPPNEPSLGKTSEVKNPKQRQVLKYPNGFVYEGEMDSGLPHGKGKLTLRDGMVMEGVFVKGVLQGQPRSLTNPWFRYEGDVLNDKPHGRGKMTLKNGEVWEGEFCESSLNGWGKIMYPDGSIEEGEFRNNMLNGRGIIHCTDGVRVEANFVDHVYEGVVKATFLNGDIQECYYVRGELQRQERNISPDGTVMEGEYLTALVNKSLPWRAHRYNMKIRHGQFKFTYPSGRAEEGEIKYGVCVGRWTHTHPSGIIHTENKQLTLPQRYQLAVAPIIVNLNAKHRYLTLVTSSCVGGSIGMVIGVVIEYILIIFKYGMLA